MGNIKKELVLLVNSNRFAKYIFYRIRRIRILNIRGKNNVIRNNGIMIKIRNDILGNDNQIFIEKDSCISDTTFYLRGDNNIIKIGKGCIFKGGSFWIDGSNSKIEIGDETTVISAHLCVEETNSSIIVGKDCMFSNNIIIRTSDSHSIIDKNTKIRINPPKSILIGNHVWIAAWVRILKGVKVADNSVLALGSIVTSDVPENCVFGGVPAKIIKENIEWCREQL